VAEHAADRSTRSKQGRSRRSRGRRRRRAWTDRRADGRDDDAISLLGVRSVRDYLHGLLVADVNLDR
jgi:hypothetical protein